MTEQEEDTSLPIAPVDENNEIKEENDLSPKVKLTSKTFQYFFFTKVFQYSILLIVALIHEFVYPWCNVLTDTDTLHHCLYGVAPCLIVTSITLIIITGKVELDSNISILFTFVSSIFLGAFLVYLRFYLERSLIYYWVFFLGTTIFCLTISLIFFGVKEHYLIVINSTLIFGIIGYFVLFYTIHQSVFVNKLVFVNCILAFVVYVYLICICLYLDYKNEEKSEEEAIIFACKSFHWFLVPIMILGILFVVFLVISFIILKCMAKCVWDIIKICSHKEKEKSFWEKEEERREKEKQDMIEYLAYAHKL